MPTGSTSARRACPCRPSLDDTSAAELVLPTEAFVRLVYGRLDAGHTPATVTAHGVDLDVLRSAFPGL